MTFASSRRDFLRTSAAVGLAATLGPSAARAALPRPIPWLDAEDFRELDGERVVLRTERGPAVAARVVAVDSGARTDDGVTVEYVSIHLRTGLRDALEQQIFALEHPSWGHVELFMVPVVSRERGVHYQAVVSRLVD
jgi:hypothetical protein